jgi:hypothetical protein
MSRRVLLPCALLALAVLVPCFVGGGTRGGNGRALRVPREGTAVPKATTETPKPKEEPKEPKEPKAETPKSVALVQVTKEKLGKKMEKWQKRVVQSAKAESLVVKDMIDFFLCWQLLQTWDFNRPGTSGELSSA